MGTAGGTADVGDWAVEFFTREWSTESWVTHGKAPEQLRRQWGIMDEGGLLNVLTEPQLAASERLAYAGAIVEAAGNTGFPGPLVETLIARWVIQRWLQEEARQAGPRDVVTFAHAEPQQRGFLGSRATTVRARRCVGTKSPVEIIPGTELAIVTGTYAHMRAGAYCPVVMLVQLDAGNHSVHELETVDPTRMSATLVIDGAPVHGVIDGAKGDFVYRAALGLFLALTSHELLGASRAVLKLSVDYAKQRHQFGRPIGSFQAIQHILADMHVELTLLQSACARLQAWNLDDVDMSGLEAFTRLAVATKAYASRIGRKTVEAGLQVHGGIGFTEEYPLAGYYRRVLSLEAAGADARHLGRLMMRFLLHQSWHCAKTNPHA